MAGARSMPQVCIWQRTVDHPVPVFHVIVQMLEVTQTIPQERIAERTVGDTDDETAEALRAQDRTVEEEAIARTPPRIADATVPNHHAPRATHHHHHHPHLTPTNTQRTHTAHTLTHAVCHLVLRFFLFQ